MEAQRTTREAKAGRMGGGVTVSSVVYFRGVWKTGRQEPEKRGSFRQLLGTSCPS